MQQIENYNPLLVSVIARIMCEMNILVLTDKFLNAQQYTLRKRLIKFGKRRENAGVKEMKQLHNQTCFKPISIRELTESEKSKIVKAVLLLQEKRDKTMKGRCVYNEKPMQN